METDSLRMQQNQTIVTSLEGEASSSGRNAESNSMTSPRSPLSQNTFDSFEANSLFGNGSTTLGGSLSNVGSIVGHDDPTLVHTNIAKSPRSGWAGLLKSSGTIESFLTEYNSDTPADESREHSARFDRRLSDQELRQQLSELDRAQEQWQAQQAQNRTDEMDSTGDFYVGEAGCYRSSPRRRKSWSLSGQTIIEEDASDENTEDAFHETICIDPSHNNTNENDVDSDSNGNNDDGDDDDSNKNDDNNHINNRLGIADRAVASANEPTESLSVASSVASSVANSAIESGASDLVFEYPSTDYSDHVSPALGITKKGLVMVSESSYESEAKEEEVVILRSLEDKKPADTEEIVKQVQKRLHDLSFNSSSARMPIGVERTEPSSDQRKARFRSWIPVDDEVPEKRARGFAGGGLATKSELSDGGNATNGEYYRRRRKLCCINIFLALLIIAAIVCSILLATHMTGSRKNASSGEGLTNPTLSPISASGNYTESPSESMLSPDETPSGEPPYASPSDSSFVESPASSSPTVPPVEAPSSASPGEAGSTMSPTDMGRMDSPRPAEERIVDISGDAIFDSNTSQHEAYAWLLEDDPANLDLDSLSDRELEQRYIAALFYFALDGDNWLDQYGFLGESNLCEWNVGSTTTMRGIICDDTGVITGFAINENNLKGELPSELQELTGMTMLQLRTNRIQGTLSPGLAQLSGLQELDLRENEIVGTIPEAVFALSELRRILLLRNSQLGGTIPASIGSATNLEMMSFHRCQISGTLPETLGNLSNLFFFTLMENKLTGSIPESLTILPNLEVMELSGNMLTGPIPSFAGQTELYFVSLYDNLLTGTIPPSLGSLEGLLFLDVHDNKLTGPIPTLFGTLPEMVTFFAQNNQLTGSLPSFSGNQGLLQAINLSTNRLSGSLDQFFASGGPTNRLFTVDLSENQFTGSLPSIIGSFNELTGLVLDGNSLTGSIPPEIGFLRELNTLAIRGNGLNGTIPDELGLLQELVVLDLANNQLVGTIPETLIMLSYLSVLDLGSNVLEGTVPSTLGQLSTLEELHLNGNGLEGDITPIFCPLPSLTSRPIPIFVADCLGPDPAVNCGCCTSCCNDDGCLAN